MGWRAISARFSWRTGTESEALPQQSQCQHWTPDFHPALRQSAEGGDIGEVFLPGRPLLVGMTSLRLRNFEPAIASFFHAAAAPNMPAAWPVDARRIGKPRWIS